MESRVKITEYDNRKELHFEDAHGDADFSIYRVFDGIILVFSSIHTDKCRLSPAMEGELIEISHCREGRLERMADGDYFYMSPGDLSIVRRNHIELDAQLPNRHYHGVTVVIKADFVPKAFRTMLRDTPVNPAEVANKLCGEKNYYISRSEEYVAHIFSEFYTVPESIRSGYFKVKILELLLMLSTVDPHGNTEETRRLSLTQVTLAKEVCGYLSERMHKRPTIAELSARFHVSPTGLKQAFKGVYGVPIYSYIKVQKMQSASLMLIHTDKSILDIALDHGYSSASKFAAVFKEIMGELPADYRRAHSKISR